MNKLLSSLPFYPYTIHSNWLYAESLKKNCLLTCNQWIDQKEMEFHLKFTVMALQGQVTVLEVI